MADDFSVSRVGLFVLRTNAGGKKVTWACSSVTVSMQLNAVPGAQAVIGAGTDIASGKEQDPEDLLADILKFKDGGYTDMVACSIYEVPYSGTTKDEAAAEGRLVFKGYIVNGSLVLGTGNPSRCMLSVTCRNRAVWLEASPSSYTSLVNSKYIMKVFETQGGALNDKTGNVKDTRTNGDVSKDALLDRYATKHMNADVATRIADMVGGVVWLASANLPSAQGAGAADPSETRERISRCFFSKTKLRGDVGEWTPGQSKTVSRNYDSVLFDAASGAGVSIMQGVMSTVMSPDVLLQMVPRWSDNNFKLEICPSSAWAPKHIIQLKRADIFGIESNFHPSESAESPDVFVVEFSKGEGGSSSLDLLLALERPGVYCPKPELRRLWQAALKKGRIPDNLGDNGGYKVKFFNLPPWLLAGIVKEARNKKRTNYGHDKNRTDDIEDNAEEAAKIADKVAQALFTHYYGGTDSCRVAVSPEFRFCGEGKYEFEKHIGDAVDLQIGRKGKSVTMRGTLYGITYKHDCGSGGSSASYTLELSRIRILSEAEDEIDNPLYK